MVRGKQKRGSREMGNHTQDVLYEKNNLSIIEKRLG